MPFLPPRRFRRRLALAVATLLVVAVPAAVAMRPIPLDWKHMVGDPSVLKSGKKYVVLATGAKVNRALSKNGKVWKWKSSALPTLPAWAKPNGGDIWAADMEKVGSQFVLYYSAPVRGKTASSRCIGVATSRKAKGTFTPVGTAPLVCPSTFGGVPAAADRVIDKAAQDAYAAAAANDSAAAARHAQCETSRSANASPSTSPSASSSPTASSSATATASDSPGGYTPPTVYPDPCGPSPTPTALAPTTADNVIGAIDPSLFIDSNGAPYLLYKTDGRPSSIRLLKLSADGLHPAPGAYSQELVNNAGVLENPVMIKRGGIYYLFNSYGDYARCSYSTIWRASASLTDWRASPAHKLLTRKKTHKLCGPGGADVLVQKKKVVMYFEAWTCKRSYKPCGKNFWSYSSKYQRKHPVRALYAVKLGFHDGKPHKKKYLKGSKH